MGNETNEMPLSVLADLTNVTEDMLGMYDLDWVDENDTTATRYSPTLVCKTCGREYAEHGQDFPEDKLCPSDDCAANKARKLLKEQRGAINARIKEVDDLAGAPCINCQRGTYVPLTPDFYALQCHSCGWSSPPKIIRAAYKKAQAFCKLIREYKDKRGEQSDTTNTTQSGDERHEVP